MRLESLAAVLNGDRGKNYPAKSKLTNKGIPFVSAVNINDGVVVEDQMLYMSDGQFNALRAGKLQRDDIVFCIRGSLGKFGVFPFERGAIASSLVIVRPYLASAILHRYLLCMFDAPITSASIRSYDNGTAQPNLAAKNFEQFLFPLPPVEEQMRIIGRLAELLPLVDAYGSLEDARELLDAELPDLLRKSILQEAVQGRLVPQDPSDEPASALLGRIRAERSALVKAGKLKAPKGGESVIFRGSDGGYYEKRGKGEPQPIEVPFEIPESWEWARVSSVFNLVRGNGIKRTEVTESGEPCVRYGELYTTYRSEITQAMSRTSQAVYDKAQKLLDGELIATLTGENDIDIGRAVVNNTGDTIAFGGDLLALKGSYIDGNFATLCINSPYVGLQRTAAASGNIIVHLSADKYGIFLMAIPPLDEQKRIVSSCNELLASLG